MMHDGRQWMNMTAGGLYGWLAPHHFSRALGPKVDA